MRSQNAAKALGGAVASRRDRSRLASVLTGLLTVAVLAACTDGTTVPSVAIRPSSDAVSPRTAPPVAPTPAVPESLPADLTGLDATQVLALLGSPDFRRSEPPAELWQYRGADCILDVFLHEDSRGYRVVHAEWRQRRQIVATAGGCSAGPAGFVSRSRQSRL
jgi:hypothetical protein